MSPHDPFDPFDPFDDGEPEDASHDAASPIAGPTDLALPHAAASDPRATLAHILERLSAAFSTDADGRLDRTLAVLALSLTRYLHGAYPLRVTLVGPTGARKSMLLNVIASIVRLPGIVIPVTDIAETNWKGAQLGEACRMLHPHLFQRDEKSRRVSVPTMTVTERSVILLDEIDKIATTAHDGTRLEGSAAAARIGVQQCLLALLDPMGELLVQFEDASRPFRWSCKRSVIVCAGAFTMVPDTNQMSAADLVRVGLSPEIVDRMGPIIAMPAPSHTTRAHLARTALHDVERFAASLGVGLTGVDGFLATLPAPGPEAPYVGVRGLRHHVEQHVLASVAEALTQNVSSIALPAAQDDG